MPSPDLAIAAPPDAVAQTMHDFKLAFLRGAGLKPNAIVGDFTPETMEVLGKLLAVSLQGTIDLLAQRASMKEEVQSDRTIVLVRNNNPLKFFHDSQTVLTQMLRKKMPGFMEPLEALEDAWRDLHGHQKGMTAGARACLRNVLATMGAEQVNAALPPPGLADKIFPNRRAKQRWLECLRRHRAAVLGIDAQLHGPAFLAAYDAAVKRAEKKAA